VEIPFLEVLSCGYVYVPAYVSIASLEIRSQIRIQRERKSCF